MGLSPLLLSMEEICGYSRMELVPMMRRERHRASAVIAQVQEPEKQMLLRSAFEGLDLPARSLIITRPF